VDAIMAVVSDAIVFHNVTTAERVEGAAAFRAHVAEIHQRWPDLGFEEHALYIATDTGVTKNGRLGRQLQADGALSGTEST
jgi:hypothetical protein